MLIASMALVSERPPYQSGSDKVRERAINRAFGKFYVRMAVTDAQKQRIDIKMPVPAVDLLNNDIPLGGITQALLAAILLKDGFGVMYLHGAIL